MDKKKMKILWFSNADLFEFSSNKSGSWLRAMSQSLVENGIELYNITQGPNKVVKKEEQENLTQWTLPIYRLINKGLPEKKHISTIVSIVKSVEADIIHIWGTEAYWGLLSSRGYIEGNILLEIQGLRSTCADVYFGSMSYMEIMKCVSLKEIISPKSSLWKFRRNCYHWGKYEKEIIEYHKQISVPSDWIKARINPLLTKEHTVFKSGLAVQDAYFLMESWRYRKEETKEILAVTSAIPYKGAHILIKALSVIKKQYPDIQLKIVGHMGLNNPFYKIPGYTKYLKSLINNLGLAENVHFKGPLVPTEIIKEMKDSDVMIHASFVESYSLVLAESMVVGVPSVVSYAGAMPELVENGKYGLLYKSEDFEQCAYKVLQILQNEQLSKELSCSARECSRVRNSKENAYNIQMSIYRQLIHS